MEENKDYFLIKIDFIGKRKAWDLWEYFNGFVNDYDKPCIELRQEK